MSTNTKPGEVGGATSARTGWICAHCVAEAACRT